MTRNDYPKYLQKMSQEISAAASLLADEIDKAVPDMGEFQKVSVPFRDKKKELEITEWRLAVCQFPDVNGPDSNQRYIELIGILDGGYGVSVLAFGGTKAECITKLRKPELVSRIQGLMIRCLEDMND